MSKLIKTTSTIETAHAFASAIGRAIEENDAEIAKTLSGELREKLEAGAHARCRTCLHMREEHSALTKEEHCSMYRCGCKAFKPRVVVTAVSGTLKDTTLAQIAQRAERKSGPMPAFREGKHFATLRRVSYQKSRSGGEVLVFEMDITMSRSMELGEAAYIMRLSTMSDARVAAAQLKRLGIDPTTTFVDTEMNLNIVVIGANRTTKSGQPVISANLRLPEESDYGDEFGDMA